MLLKKVAHSAYVTLPGKKDVIRRAINDRWRPPYVEFAPKRLYAQVRFSGLAPVKFDVTEFNGTAAYPHGVANGNTGILKEAVLPLLSFDYMYSPSGTDKQKPEVLVSHLSLFRWKISWEPDQTQGKTGTCPVKISGTAPANK